ncbi:hypothetical protein Daus18300_001307 [Diaporthe australafricana]|uniref:RING-type domain-containing protein n=1 Tax=Diaporthe australafricana TaxID=127596 RepID=A0ABR3XYM2_9PEZI
MASSKPALDLEKELTCSICTELLYHPLTLLDCLHTFCGACLKDWFNWQAHAVENGPDLPAPGASVFTCPSCRAPVRDTRHNATVASLLDMVLGAHPEKAKPDAEKEEMDAKYRPGDSVLPKLNIPERTTEQLRLEERERNLIESVREMSLLEAVNGEASTSRSRRNRSGSRSRNGSSHRTRDTSATRTADVRTRERQHRRGTTTERDSSNDSRRRTDDLRERQRRHIEHQSSLRSLISSSDAADIDMEREVEEFARQIQQEGLLDGLDLENIDLINNDELSRKITEAYRRRQRERERLRHEAVERSRATSRNSHSGPSDPRPQLGASSRSANRQTEHHSRSGSATSQSDERSRPPISSRSTHLEVHEPRRRRRAASGSRDRSSTLPVGPTQPEIRVGARSQTDLDARSNSLNTSSRRPVIADGRSASTSDVPSSNQVLVQSPPSTALPFSARANGLNIFQSQERTTSEANTSSTRQRPADLVSAPSPNAPSTQLNPSLLASPPSSSGHQKHRTSLFAEPAITCDRCRRDHIEYELHYNCGECNGGNYNLCLDCYRQGKGCLHWLGFGYAAFNRWERLRISDPSLPEPHKLMASRFLPPTAMVASAAEDRKAWSTEDPYERLQSGTFCALCLAWSNECYWRCDVCNEGDWGFCNECVNQGRCCTHSLLPLAHHFALRSPGSLPPSPRSPSRPSSATMMVGLNATSIGPFKVMTFITTCDVCRMPIAPTQSRLHCFTCVSSIVPDSRPGDYDICSQCYESLTSNGGISPENGPSGWRRCLQGHRMVVVGFRDGNGGQKRYTVHDLVGGRRLQVEAVPNEPDLQKWLWYEGDEKRERLVAKEVDHTIDESDTSFPPDGGFGLKASARWAWYPAPGNNDELLFPKGAEITEIEDANGEWFHGTYMGSKGLFPAPYVRILE